MVELHLGTSRFLDQEMSTALTKARELGLSEHGQIVFVQAQMAIAFQLAKLLQENINNAIRHNAGNKLITHGSQRRNPISYR